MPYSREDYWRHKEPFYFCGDLGIADWLRVSDEREYLELFKGVDGEKRVGEASAWYLLSEEAPTRIRASGNEGVKIVVMLRSPVEWMRSWHHDLLTYGYEDIADFGLALAAEDARTRGERLPRRAAFAGCLSYRKAARFSGQVRRYYEMFGRENVFVGLMGDMRREPAAFMKSLLEFLEVDSLCVPEVERRNDSTVLPATHLFNLAVGRVVDRLPGGGAIKWAFTSGPNKLVGRVVSRILPPLSDKSIEPGLERELREEFAVEIDELGSLIGRDLEHWHAGARAGAISPLCGRANVPLASSP